MEVRCRGRVVVGGEFWKSPVLFLILHASWGRGRVGLPHTKNPPGREMQRPAHFRREPCWGRAQWNGRWVPRPLQVAWVTPFQPTQDSSQVVAPGACPGPCAQPWPGGVHRVSLFETCFCDLSLPRASAHLRGVWLWECTEVLRDSGSS